MEILQIHAEHYANSLSFLQSAVNHLLQSKEEDFWEDAAFIIPLHESLLLMSDICEKDELPVTQVLVAHVKGLIDIGLDETNPLSQVAPQALDKALLSQYLERMRLTLIDELSTKLFFQLPNNKKQWFESPMKGWEKVIERFPETVTDIEEMSKCFALSRYPGAIFHSLLVAESGLISLGKVIDVTDPKLGWDATSRKLDDLMRGGHSKYPDSLPITFAACEQINQSVQAMKHAWRNKVNHVAGKLMVIRSDFAPDIAEEIIFATRGFMRRLADDLPK